MAVKNLTFPEAVQFNNNNLVSKTHTLSQVVSHGRPKPNVSSGINASTLTTNNFTFYSPSFPYLKYSSYSINHQKKKKKITTIKGLQVYLIS
jgi:hypothetical protein